MKLKNLIREIHDGERLYPSDIYNLSYLEYLYSTAQELFKTDYGEFILKTYSDALKRKYVTIFKHLLADQLTKYAQRQRTDPDFDSKAISPTTNASVLWDLIKKTFRSDMKRRNDLWILIAEYTAKLERSQNLKEMFTYINMLNNAVHNTGGSILGKIDHSHELLNAFERVHRAKSVGEYERFVDKDLRRLKSQNSF